MTSNHTRSSSPRSPRNAGFTLAELLLASVLGAMLLTALSVSTFGFAANLEYHESKAGINNDTDPVLRRITRDVREAWWIELVNASHIKIAAPDGSITEYYLEDDELKILRANGDAGVLLKDVSSLNIIEAVADRNREGVPIDYDTVWYSQTATSGAPVALKTGYYEEISIGFVAPALPSDLPGMPADVEEVTSTSTSIVQVPVAWIPGTGAHQFELSIFESRGPGSAKPTGNFLAKVSLPGASLPQAVVIDEDNDIWEVPTIMVPISIGASLEAGVGYVLILDPQGDSEIVVQADPVFPSPAIDDVAKGDAFTSAWTVQPMIVPVSISGPFQVTSTTTQSVITRLTFELTVEDRAMQTRSAAILSQIITDDEWLGSVPGEAAP
jgi:hypothetical protein